MAALTGLVVDLRAAWDYGVVHVGHWAVRLVADAYDFACIHQRLDLLAWGETEVTWEIAHPSVPERWPLP